MQSEAGLGSRSCTGTVGQDWSLGSPGREGRGCLLLARLRGNNGVASVCASDVTCNLTVRMLPTPVAMKPFIHAERHVPPAAAGGIMAAALHCMGRGEGRGGAVGGQARGAVGGREGDRTAAPLPGGPSEEARNWPQLSWRSVFCTGEGEGWGGAGGHRPVAGWLLNWWGCPGQRRGP